MSAFAGTACVTAVAANADSSSALAALMLHRGFMVGGVPFDLTMFVAAPHALRYANKVIR
jgi:hypothetical protein